VILSCAIDIADEMFNTEIRKNIHPSLEGFVQNSKFDVLDS
jgi:hypothetical protein